MLTGFSKRWEKQPYGIGHFFQAMAIDAFISEAEFKKTTGDILRDSAKFEKIYRTETGYLQPGRKNMKQKKITRPMVLQFLRIWSQNLISFAKELTLNGYHF